ncbi:MAG: hypothetical protein OMM_10176 [Candidatus Magnetoglobus multicellularis str. Araruama]|uniref:Uncharacterized protein n=1 Tax=Candidatus Magnetoglobus multicellularis str. Araruama TaxID=890399 RepID=A0A1V1P1V4_9BACT|nr:MAG: hypothetical protein OMM_10176 [Candidatus Magnetoglobus multicellularis str. Araruama]
MDVGKNSPAFVTDFSRIYLNIGTGALTDGDGKVNLGNDHFAVSWEKNFEFESGSYLFPLRWMMAFEYGSIMLR